MHDPTLTIEIGPAGAAGEAKSREETPKRASPIARWPRHDSQGSARPSVKQLTLEGRSPGKRCPPSLPDLIRQSIRFDKALLCEGCPGISAFTRVFDAFCPGMTECDVWAGLGGALAGPRARVRPIRP